MKDLILFALLCCLVFTKSIGQKIPPHILQQRWKAFWITVPGEPAKDYGVYQFRKSFELSAIPDSFIIHVSGDNRYKLYVNGKLSALGPARGDIYNWNFETADISSFLKLGRNIITAVVWNFGDLRPEAQISHRTAFILQGNSATEEIINTDKSWKCQRDKSYSPLPPELLYTYYVSGPGEMIDNNKSTEGWMENNYVDTGWLAAGQLFNGLPKGAFEYTAGWMLVPRKIPPMELTEQRLGNVRKAEGIQLPANFPKTKNRIIIPPNSKSSMLLDQGFLTNAYPVLQFSKGKDAAISLGYAEALYIDEGVTKDWRAQNKKGNRNDIKDKRFVGVKDKVISNGRVAQQFTSLWWRTYRYLQLEIQTFGEELVLDDLYGIFTGYPFEMKAKFNTDIPELTSILETGWRTARLCAMETYMDCPYYEQLQYVGDTRIQCLVSLFNSGDDRLVRNAIDLLDNSRISEGITLSRYPTANSQQIPPFSLWWIGMLHDYWMYRPDGEYIKSKLPGLRQVLWFFSKYQQPDGSLKQVPYWNFTDWAETRGWDRGVAPVGRNGNSAALDLQLLLAYQLASRMEEKMGMKDFAGKYNQAALQLKKSIREKYWDSRKELFADTPEKNVFSQHSNSLAILTELITGNSAKQLAQKLLSDTSLTQATIYFKYYLHQAIAKVGLGDLYLTLLGDWHNNLRFGLTTWAEISDINDARSDCHAWGSSPNIEFFRIVLGIDSDSVGFKRIKIQPHLGSLKRASGRIPHPNGDIEVSYEQKNGKWTSVVSLPPGLPGELRWKGKVYKLRTGEKNVLNF